MRTQAEQAQAQGADSLTCPECGQVWPLADFEDVPTVAEYCPARWLLPVMLVETVLMAMPAGHARRWNPSPETTSRRASFMFVTILVEQVLVLFLFGMVPIVAVATETDELYWFRADNFLPILACGRSVGYAFEEGLWRNVLLLCTAFAPATLVLAAAFHRIEFAREGWREARWVHAVRRCFAATAPGILLLGGYALPSIMLVGIEPVGPLVCTWAPWLMLFGALVCVASLTRTGWIDWGWWGAVRYTGYGIIAFGLSVGWVVGGSLLLTGEPLDVFDYFDLFLRELLELW